MKKAENFLEEWRRCGAVKKLNAGNFLWQEGDPGEEAVLVVEGTLEVIQQSPDGRELVLRSSEPGDILGEMACLDGKPHSASVRAKTLCLLSVVTAKKLRELLERHPENLQALFQEQVMRVRSLTNKVANLGFESIVGRVAKQLLDESRKNQSLILPLTHQEIAERVAATRESVTKSLGLLASRGFIALSRGKIRILSLEGLEKNQF